MPTRVHIGRLDAITGGTDQFGLYVFGPDGTTIIDGTSNVFKIVATGTMAFSGPDGDPTQAAAFSEIDLPTGLTYKPAVLGYWESGTLSYPLPLVEFAAAGTLLRAMYISSEVVNTDQTRVECRVVANADYTATTFTFRYFVFQEVAF